MLDRRPRPSSNEFSLIYKFAWCMDSKLLDLEGMGAGKRTVEGGRSKAISSKSTMDPLTLLANRVC